MSQRKDHSVKLNAIREIATGRGWTLITEVVPHHQTILEFKCERGHSIFKRFTAISIGGDSAKRLGRCPCPKCRLEDAETKFLRAVEAKGGRVLGKFINNNTNTPIQCSKGHIWSTSPKTIYDHWCGICSGFSAHTAKEKFDRIVSEKGGRLIGEYLTNGRKMSIICRYGHTWMTTSNAINSGNWCLKCSGHSPEIGRAKFLNVVENEYGGKVLGEYINSRTRTLTQCRNGHKWYALPATVCNHSNWCPECSQSQGERLTTECLHNLNLPVQLEVSIPLLPSRRYDILTYFNRHIFIEFDGRQHFKGTEFFNITLAEQHRCDIEKTKAVVEVYKLRMIRIGYKVLKFPMIDVQTILAQAIQCNEPILYVDVFDGKLTFSSQCERYSWLTSQLQILKT